MLSNFEKGLLTKGAILNNEFTYRSMGVREIKVREVQYKDNINPDRVIYYDIYQNNDSLSGVANINSNYLSMNFKQIIRAINLNKLTKESK